VLVFRDVTSLRRAEETSRLLGSIVESSADAIIGKNLEGIVTSWNSGAERIFGYSALEMIGRPVSVLAAPDRLDDPDHILRQIRQDAKVEQYETVRRRKDGALINVSLTVSPVYDALGRLVGASKIARDITGRVQSSARLARLNAELQRSNENLARSNQDLERFAFVASHDLQEPLRMITVYSQLLVRTYPTDDGNAAAFVNNIVSGTKRMRDLLADLLAYAEIGAGLEQPLESVDLKAVLENVELNLKVAIETSGATIVSGKLPVLRAYGSHFVSLLQNLISNAIKYRSDSPPHIQIIAEEIDGLLRFSVKDNGIGIAKEYHEKIFVAFKRLHGNNIPGTGIGLAICQRVVERYGGRIWVDSDSDRGAIFSFTIPDVSWSWSVK
jgi:PAS domain S-box-containing protein